MQQDKMTQDEVDALVKRLNSSEEIEPDKTIDKDWVKKAKRSHNAVMAAGKRLEYARTYGTFEEARQAEINLRRAAFSHWLFKHNEMTKKDYYTLMNKEAVKKGLNPPFTSS